MAVFKEGNNWFIDYRDNRKRRVRKKIGLNRKLAENVLAKIKAAIAENRYLDKRKESKIGFEELCLRYINYAKVNKRSWRRDQISLKNMTKYFGKALIDTINADSVESYKRRRLEHVSQATTNRELACLRYMFNKAIEWGLVENNPMKKVKLFKENNQRIRYLDNEGIKTLCANCSDHLKPILMTALLTGMRKSEILKLKWEDVDLTQRIIYIANTKNGEIRETPINDQLYDLLKVMEHKSQFVFAKDKGEPYIDIDTGFKAALRRAKIDNFRFHDLRHTYASHLVMSGVDLMTVKELLGHKTIKMTLRYAHLSPFHKMKAVQSLKFFDGHFLDTSKEVKEAENILSRCHTTNGGLVLTGKAVDLKSTGLIAHGGSNPSPSAIYQCGIWLRGEPLWFTAPPRIDTVHGFAM
jgi:integrase